MRRNVSSFRALGAAAVVTLTSALAAAAHGCGGGKPSYCDSSCPEAYAGYAGSAGSAGRGGAGQAGTPSGGSGGASGGGGTVAAGAAGASGSGTGGAAPPSWLFDSAAWTPVAMTGLPNPDCTLWEGNLEKLPFPPVTGSDCGLGCVSFDTGWDLGRVAYTRLTTRRVGTTGEVFLTMTPSALAPQGKTQETRRVIRLEANGKTVAAARLLYPTPTTWSACQFAGIGNDAWPVATLDPPNGISKQLLGRADPQSGAWSWARPARTPAEMGLGTSIADLFSIDHGGGQLFVLNDSVRVLSDWTKSDFQELVPPGVAAFRGAGEGDLAVWAEAVVSPPRLRGWAPDGKGVRVLVSELPAKPLAMGVSSTRIAGAVSMVNGSSGTTDLRFWSFPRGYVETTALASSPRVPLPEVVVSRLSTWGDHVAASVFSIDGGDGSVRVVVARTSDWKFWRISPSSGNYLTGDLTLTDGYVYVSERAKDDFLPDLRRVVRYDLSQLDVSSEPLVQQ